MLVPRSAWGYMIIHMKQLLIQLDDATAAQLEHVAPGKSRKRSEFLRGVIARGVQEALEANTRKAYERWPDAPPPFDAADWADESEALHPPATTGRRRAPKKEKRR
jgi:hypothetical protein